MVQIRLAKTVRFGDSAFIEGEIFHVHANKSVSHDGASVSKAIISEGGVVKAVVLEAAIAEVVIGESNVVSFVFLHSCVPESAVVERDSGHAGSQNVTVVESAVVEGDSGEVRVSEEAGVEFHVLIGRAHLWLHIFSGDGLIGDSLHCLTFSSCGYFQHLPI